MVKYLIANEMPQVRFPEGAEIGYNFWDVCRFEIVTYDHLQLTFCRFARILQQANAIPIIRALASSYIDGQILASGRMGLTS